MKLLIKGFIIGIGKILPGISGCMLAISLGIYENLIEKIANLKKDTYNNLIYLTKTGIGIVIAIILTSKIIVKYLSQYYFATMLLLTGLIIGGMTTLIKQTKLKKKNIPIIALLILVITTITNMTSKINHQIEYTIQEFIKLIGIGIIDAVSSIVPGISGTAILMNMGYYNTIMETYASILNKNKITKNIFILTPFMIGFIIGTIIIAKIINNLLKKQKDLINTLIIILMSSSIITLLKNTIGKSKNKIETIIGIILLIIGIITSIKLENKNT